LASWRGYLATDQRWLSSLPNSALAVGDTVLETPESLTTLKAAVRALAAASAETSADDAPAGTRSVASLLRDRWQARGHLACVVTRLVTDEELVFVVTPGVPYTMGETTKTSSSSVTSRVTTHAR